MEGTMSNASLATLPIVHDEPKGSRTPLSGAAWERAHVHHLIWLFPAVYAVHVTEESLGFPRWVTTVLGGDMDVRAFYVNNAGFMVLMIGLCALAAWKRAPWAYGALFVWTTGQQLCNAVFHVYAQIVFNAYSPGVVSAVFGYVPVYGYLTYLAVRERLFPRWLIPIALAAGAIGMVFTVWAGLYHFGPMPGCRWAPFACP
jgi:Protein of unknown function with HXXEE motif